ncbi:MAG: threonine-phosphate decarboxylase [Syntrophobacterales bacterium CG_4_8_14_3_um_filter_49_14]|nr:MAG: threonine-phosphate decarboxylase [Syntrophobacterales bacterium CG_4_9_14_3_um_filter_49_8]PJC76042.1 MAG: threonine-phosphate decarboxylase [Syntrophobacterales bacterium CG_4_8_14_3_um_filter_49_14]
MGHHVYLVPPDGRSLHHDPVDSTTMKNEHGGNISEVSRRCGIDEDRIIDFSANINPLGYPPAVRETIVKEVNSVLNYPDDDSFDLISGLSEYHGIGRDNILVGNGSTEFIYWIPIVFKPRKALIVTPAFSEYEMGLRIAGSEISYFQAESDFSVSIDCLCSRMREKFDIFYLCNPANPTGVLTPKDELCRVIAYAQEANILAVIDEAFIDFMEDESLKKEIFRFPNLIVLRSMTKFFGIPGLRIGYVMAGASCIAKIKENKPPWTVSSLGQRAAAKALFDGDYIKNTRKYVTTEREFLRNALDEILGLKTYESAANFILVHIANRIGLNSTEIRDRLAKEGILVRDCSTFHGLGNRYLRIAVKRREQNIIIIEKMKEILKKYVPGT